ncbi:MAG: tetratricopeptide repeat protein [Bacteroidota bacterium]
MLRSSLLLLLVALPVLAHGQSRTPEQREAEAQAAFVEALAMQWSGDHEDAISAFDRILKDDPTRAAVYDALAESHAALGQYPEALLAAEDAGRLAPDDPDVLARLGAEQRRAGQQEAAAATLERALRSVPTSADLLATLADLYTELGRDAEAVRTLERLVRIGDTPAARLRLAAYARQSGDVTAAIRHLKRAARLAPGESAIAVALAEALGEAGRATEADEVLSRFLRRRPGDIDALTARSQISGAEVPADSRPSEDRLARARDLFEASDEDPDGLTEAEDLIRSLLTEAPSRFETLALGGHIAFRMRDYPLASDRLLAALEADPRDARAWGLALRAMARSRDSRASRTADDALLFLASDPFVSEGAAEVLVMLDRPVDALDAAPATPDGAALRAMALVALDRVEEAETALGDATGASPLLLHAAQGDLASASGEADAAREAWTRALQFDPNAAWVRARLD